VIIYRECLARAGPCHEFDMGRKIGRENWRSQRKRLRDRKSECLERAAGDRDARSGDALEVIFARNWTRHGDRTTNAARFRQRFKRNTPLRWADASNL
jgi:hypothetical protein